MPAIRIVDRDTLTTKYVLDLRTKIQVEIDLRVFQMRRLGIPQERIASCLGILQQTISKHLQHLATSPNVVNTDLKRGFTVAQVGTGDGPRQLADMILNHLENRA